MRVNLQQALRDHGVQGQILSLRPGQSFEHIKLQVSPDTAQRMRGDTTWMTDGLPGATMKGKRWFPVTLHYVPQYFLHKEDLAVEIAASNQVTVEKVKPIISATRESSRQLRGQSASHGSLLIHCASSAEVNKLLRSPEVSIWGVTVLARPFIKSTHNKRCYKCNKYGHVASNCREIETCHNCGKARAGHEEGESCSPRCINCNGSHSARSRDCPRWRQPYKITRHTDSEGDITSSE